jgi:hypothetical protein
MHPKWVSEEVNVKGNGGGLGRSAELRERLLPEEVLLPTMGHKGKREAIPPSS